MLRISAYQSSEKKLSSIIQASGCISSGQGYETDTLGEIFVKVNKKEGVIELLDRLMVHRMIQADIMCQGEFVSLQTMEATSTILVPHPIKAVNLKREL